MKNTIYTSLILFSLFLSSCKEKEPDGCRTIVVDITCELLYFDKDGNNLLNPETVNGYSHKDIKLYKDEGLTQLVDKTILFQYSAGWLIDMPVEIIRDSTSDNLIFGTVYLKLNDETVDTIYIETIRKDCGIYLNKVLINGIEEYHLGESKGIKIIK